MKISSASCITFSKENQMTKKPHADTGLAKHIERRVLELKSKKSQLQIASEAGFPNPNMVTMIKTGTSKLALDRVPSMARALDVIPPSCCAWVTLAEPYDDGGISGGTLERPGLKRLMQDIEAGLVDQIVVYKIDRLTRSLADFARLVDRLDAANASFVSVTQSFNTATSMGRLTASSNRCCSLSAVPSRKCSRFFLSDLKDTRVRSSTMLRLNSLNLF
jgi:hypothetical protein